MKEDATSLERLNDLALPPSVPWWPLAPGWYLVIAAMLIGLGFLAHRCWKKWRAHAYRRSALAELKSAPDATAIAELLRRSALAIAPRASIAALSGEAWLDWLAAQSPQPITDGLRQQLTAGVYGKASTSPADLAALREFASGWINTHRPSQD
jgi:hypothetical protein